MRNRLKLFFSIILFWLTVFIVYKILFLTYHSDKTSELPFSDVLLIFLYGFRMDLSMTGYFLLPTGLLMIGFLKFNKGLKWSLNILHIFLLVFCTLFVVIDLELYRLWNFRLDATPILYVTTNAKGAMALGDNWVIIRQIVIWIATVGSFTYAFLKLVSPQIEKFEKIHWKFAPLLLILTASMILPIRGTLGMTPLNAGFVFFHDTNTFANHSALNLIWNIGKSVSQVNKVKSPPDLLEPEKADELWNELFVAKNDSTIKVLNTNRPNIILFIVENFTSKFIETLGGKTGVTPNLEKFIDEGILFTHFYGNGDRTERGIVSVLSACPQHPTTSIVKFTNKTQHMGFISAELGKNGYTTSNVSGYDLSYANLRAYFSNGGFDKIISAPDYDPSIPVAKWGIDDHYVFDRLLTELDEIQKPFFNLCITLSSHHPFTVPMETVIEGDDEDSRFMNAAYYTDKSLGEFIEKAKTKDWWDNTLVILTADHGNIAPRNVFNEPDNGFKIPMIWFGGALAKKDTTISTYGSQNDIANTLMGQLDIKTDAFKFSRNLLATNSKSFAQFSFNNGFGFVNDSTLLMYDNVSNKYIHEAGASSELEKSMGKAAMQKIYKYLDSL